MFYRWFFIQEFGSKFEKKSPILEIKFQRNICNFNDREEGHFSKLYAYYDSI